MISKKNEEFIKQIRKEKYPKARLYRLKKSKKGYFLEREEI